MELFEQQNIPFLLSALQVMGETDNSRPDDNILERIEENQTRWASFIGEQKKH